MFLQSVADGERDEANPNLLRVNFSKAYDASLRKYHGWLMQNLHKVPGRGGRGREREERWRRWRRRRRGRRAVMRVVGKTKRSKWRRCRR